MENNLKKALTELFRDMRGTMEAINASEYNALKERVSNILAAKAAENMNEMRSTSDLGVRKDLSTDLFFIEKYLDQNGVSRQQFLMVLDSEGVKYYENNYGDIHIISEDE